jgi:predicted transcriptional regulator
MISITLSHEAIRGVDELADLRGMTRSAFIEWMIREESLRMRIDLSRYRRRGR